MEELVSQLYSVDINSVNAVVRLIVAMLLGAIVGLERKRKGQPAGVRTFSLISMGAALCMILSIYVPQEFIGLKNGDPGRIAAQVVTGVGFLGAGAIIQMKGSVRGLTTAAGIWMVAALGMSVGVGMYLVAIVSTMLMWFVLVLLERFEHRVAFGSESRTVRLRLEGIITDIEPYKKVLHDNRMQLQNFYVEYDYDKGQTQLNLIVLARENIDYLRLCQEFERLYPTHTISLANQINI